MGIALEKSPGIMAYFGSDLRKILFVYQNAQKDFSNKFASSQIYTGT